ncbi:MAG: glycosyltransferase family 4 protein [Halobacteriota archaeon]
METTAPGGINTVVREVGRGIVQREHRVTVLQPSVSKRPREEMYAGFKIQRVAAPCSGLFYGFDISLCSLTKHYRALNPDIVHVHGFHSLFSPEVVYLISRIDPDVPLIFSYHLDVFRERILAKWLWDAYKVVGRKLIAPLTHVISDSTFEAETLASEFHVPDDLISVIPLGVSVIDPRKKNPSSQRGPRLLYAGHLLKRKNIRSIIESLGVLVYEKKVDGAHLTIIGEGPDRARISRLIRERRLEAYVTMKPFLASADLRLEMKSADIFLLLSDSEAYGLAVAEALALGTPSIVTNATALREFIDEPGCFSVDYPPDPRAVAERVMTIYTSDVRVGPFSSKIRTWETVSRAFERFYCRYVKMNL